jgi:hemoglobin
MATHASEQSKPSRTLDLDQGAHQIGAHTCCGPDFTPTDLDRQMTDTALTDAERRAQIVQQTREQTGIDETMIEQLVRGFYARIRADELLGPIFASRIQDWEPHLRRMCAFWSSVVLSSGVYHGQPMRMHLPLPVDAQHFDRWLQLFEQTARELFSEPIAWYFIERAQRIARSLELGIATTEGVLLAPGERFKRA